MQIRWKRLALVSGILAYLFLLIYLSYLAYHNGWAMTLDNSGVPNIGIALIMFYMIGILGVPLCLIIVGMFITASIELFRWIFCRDKSELSPS